MPDVGGTTAAAPVFWLAVGGVGAACFASRWLVQAWASRRARRSVVPPSFWVISIAGSLLLTLYFSLGRRDLVGVLSNALPLLVGGYNLALSIQREAAAQPRALLSTCPQGNPPDATEPSASVCGRRSGAPWRRRGALECRARLRRRPQGTF